MKESKILENIPKDKKKKVDNGVKKEKLQKTAPKLVSQSKLVHSLKKHLEDMERIFIYCTVTKEICGKAENTINWRNNN